MGALVVWLRLIIYGLLVFFGFCTFVGVSVLKDRFFSYCPLFFSKRNVRIFSPTDMEPVSNCDYPIAIAIIFQLFYALFRIVTLVLLAVGKLTTEMMIFSAFLEFLYVLIDVVVLFLTFAGSIILSAGHFAGFLTEYKDMHLITPSVVAQVGSWVSTGLWLLSAVVGFLYIRRTGKLPWRASDGPTATHNIGNTVTISQPPDYSPVQRKM